MVSGLPWTLRFMVALLYAGGSGLEEQDSMLQGRLRMAATSVEKQTASASDVTTGSIVIQTEKDDKSEGSEPHPQELDPHQCSKENKDSPEDSPDCAHCCKRQREHGEEWERTHGGGSNVPSAACSSGH